MVTGAEQSLRENTGEGCHQKVLGALAYCLRVASQSCSSPLYGQQLYFTICSGSARRLTPQRFPPSSPAAPALPGFPVFSALQLDCGGQRGAREQSQAPQGEHWGGAGQPQGGQGSSEVTSLRYKRLSLQGQRCWRSRASPRSGPRKSGNAAPQKAVGWSCSLGSQSSRDSGTAPCWHSHMPGHCPQKHLVLDHKTC